MDKAQYLLNKKRRLEQKLEEEKTHRHHCLHCMRPQKICFCRDLKTVKTNVHFCLLMHPKEAKKENLGTGRLTNVILDNCRIIVDKTFDENIEFNNLINNPKYFPLLLYPGDTSHNINDQGFSHFNFAGKTPLILILDGTWPCAKSMMRDSKVLHDLPRVCFTPKNISRFSIKHQPDKYCLSTIESVHEVLKALEEAGVEQDLKNMQEFHRALDQLVAFQVKCASDPALQGYRRKQGAYKTPDQRSRSKKWNKRKICFK